MRVTHIDTCTYSRSLVSTHDNYLGGPYLKNNLFTVQFSLVFCPLELGTIKDLCSTVIVVVVVGTSIYLLTVWQKEGVEWPSIYAMIAKQCRIDKILYIWYYIDFSLPAFPLWTREFNKPPPGFSRTLLPSSSLVLFGLWYKFRPEIYLFMPHLYMYFKPWVCVSLLTTRTFGT